jgi:hypothetical protein
MLLGTVTLLVGIPGTPLGVLGTDNGTVSTTVSATNGGPPSVTTGTRDTETSEAETRGTDTSKSSVTDTAQSTINETNTVLYRVNVGGPRLESNDDGPDWSADRETNPSNYLNVRESKTVVNYTPDRITVENGVRSTVPNAMFKTYRFSQGADTKQYAEMVWSFPVDPNRDYAVRLYFIEPYFTDGPSGRKYEEPYSEGGPRSFGVAIENEVVLTHYEPFVAHGHDVGAVESFEVTVDDGVLTIRFLRERENPIVSGIAIIDTGPREKQLLVNAGTERFSADHGSTSPLSRGRAGSLR